MQGPEAIAGAPVTNDQFAAGKFRPEKLSGIAGVSLASTDQAESNPALQVGNFDLTRYGDFIRKSLNLAFAVFDSQMQASLVGGSTQAMWQRDGFTLTRLRQRQHLRHVLKVQGHVQLLRGGSHQPAPNRKRLLEQCIDGEKGFAVCDQFWQEWLQLRVPVIFLCASDLRCFRQPLKRR